MVIWKNTLLLLLIFLTNKEDRHDAVDFYQMAIEARKQIQRGKHLNEKM
ncbi:response regulator aspartate phosphatase I [Bacillus subtilis]|nr:response regulator aspartate phosphatase I [Bacillus subtilis]